ncbi:prepilin peptidase-dependent protein [Buttiauxella warmboldiae]|uniref:Prepilin peptidase-dependent protein n=1 Tax=Buttiauxella warmboldiae TaxID=82993 RepID=A0A3N5DF93_9ENTR|nr:prepilin peptidase-dependent protein [Buttiauxella warmboldiae]RPH27228.1 prepilin peptidase-dependent protein [Buttiauxella warmboldiae]
MQLNQQGFTLLETLIAMTLSSIVLLGAGRLFPALQGAILLQYQRETLQESLWQLAFSLGKQLQRAGYCHGTCQGEGLVLGKEGGCVLLQWDGNSNGRWEPPGHAETERAGFRLSGGNLEVMRGATSCEGAGWEKISDPAMMVIRSFSVTRQARLSMPPLLIISLAATFKNGQHPVSTRHIVVGYNL